MVTVKEHYDPTTLFRYGRAPPAHHVRRYGRRGLRCTPARAAADRRLVGRAKCGMTLRRAPARSSESGHVRADPAHAWVSGSQGVALALVQERPVPSVGDSAETCGPGRSRSVSPAGRHCAGHRFSLKGGLCRHNPSRSTRTTRATRPCGAASTSVGLPRPTTSWWPRPKRTWPPR
ncbi:hypothetical protein [Streptomyces sp. NPDC018584]|uniref:hypothetical protein n=1 Tax=unclassified Streptomyces TaxID=2593676 RepID=UPI00378919AB